MLSRGRKRGLAPLYAGTPFRHTSGSTPEPFPAPYNLMSEPLATARLALPFVEPYDWPRVLRFFAGRATRGVEAVEHGAYRRAIEWAGDA